MISVLVLVTFTVPPGTCESPAITDVFQPGNGTAWVTGTSNLIAWHAVNVSGNVSIDLLRGGTLILNLTKEANAVADNSTGIGVWSWDTPDNLGNGGDYQVRITSESSPSASATSPMFSITGPAISDVSLSASGTAWTVGTINTILWHPLNLAGTVRIDLLKGGSPLRNLATGVGVLSGSDYGVVNCALPSDIPTGTDYQIRVTSESVPACMAASGNFTVDGAAITDVFQPAGGAMWSSGTVGTILWHYTHLAGTVRIDLLKGGSLFRTLATGANVNGTTSGVGERNWNVPYDLSPGTDYQIRVTSESVPACTAKSDNFGFVAPRITVTQPSNGTAINNTDTYRITWDFFNLPMNDSVMIELWRGGSLDRLLTPGVAITIVMPGAGEWNWHLPGDVAPGNDYKIRVISNTAPACYGESGQFSVNGNLATPTPTPTPTLVPTVSATPTAEPSATPGATATATAKPSGSAWVVLTAAGILATAYLYRKK